MSISKYLKTFLAESAREREEKELEEKKELTGDQKELDVDKDGDIEADDLADLRAKKKKIEEEIAKYDDKTKTTKNDDTDLEDTTDDDEDETIDEDGVTINVKSDDDEEEKEEKEEEEEKEEKEEEEEEDKEEMDEEIAEFDDESNTTVNNKGSLEEATIVLPSDSALISLKALSKKANTMLVPKVKAELEKKGLIKGGKITQVGKDLLDTPDAEDKIKEIGS